MPRSPNVPKKIAPKIARRQPAKRASAKPIGALAALGALPEWNLGDLYTSLEDPAIKRDLDRADAACVAFEEAYKGKLGDMAKSPQAGTALAAAVRRYEAIDDLIGRSGPTPA